MEIADINLKLVLLAAKRVCTLGGDDNSHKMTLVAYPEARISSERPELAFVPANANRPQVKYLLLRSVRVQQVNSSSASENLELNRDLILDAIRAGRADDVKDLLSQYLDMLEAFLSSVGDHGLRFTSEAANMERGLFPIGLWSLKLRDITIVL